MNRWASAAAGFGVACALALVVAVVYLGVARLHPVQSGLPGAATTAPATATLDSSALGQSQTRATLLGWEGSGRSAAELKPEILQLAMDEFAGQTRYESPKLRQQVNLLPPGDYNARSISHCDDASDVRSTGEAWLLDVQQDRLYVNEGFVSPTVQSPVDLFFRYVIGLYNVAPELKSYPGGVKSSDGATAYYEKGLILLGKRAEDQLLRRDCYLQYRKPIQEAFSAYQAAELVSRLGLTPSAGYDYPQKRNLNLFRARIAPQIGASGATLVEPFMKTDSGEFYRRVGKALNPSLGGDGSAAAAAADKLFRQVFPAS